jgi:Carbohydrate esterase, sialic acid-specific acetylesterase
MRTILLVSVSFLIVAHAASADEISRAKLVLASPCEYQVFQRRSHREGFVTVAGRLSFVNNAIPARVELSGWLTGQGAYGALSGKWQSLAFDSRVPSFRCSLPTPAGGWYRLDIRVQVDGKTVAEVQVRHLGMGEVFVVAGQSNAANHGEKLTKTVTGRVAAFNGGAWALANDPQPGASGSGGSFIPAFGDSLAAKYKVPIGITNVSVGATSVRQWLPKGERIAILPTLTPYVVTVGQKQWECSGGLFDNLMTRMEQLGPHGFRAVLWHQGESDANQAFADRTLPGKLYRSYLEKIIRRSRLQADWDIPWLVAQATYHSPEDAGSPDIRTAQKSLWTDGIALEGLDTDALTGNCRDGGGRGIHFSEKGLKAHGQLWADKVAVYLDKVLAKP